VFSELVERLTALLEQGMNPDFDMGQSLSSAEKARYFKQRAQCYFRVSVCSFLIDIP
jgi:hypothetical protein